MGRSTFQKTSTLPFPSSCWHFYPFLNVHSKDSHKVLSVVRERNLRKRFNISWDVYKLYRELLFIGGNGKYSYVTWSPLGERSVITALDLSEPETEGPTVWLSLLLFSRSVVSFTISWSLLKLRYIASVMPSNHLILHLLLPPSIFPSIRVFSNESAVCIRWPKYWSLSFTISPSSECSGLTSLCWFHSGLLHCS